MAEPMLSAAEAALVNELKTPGRALLKTAVSQLLMEKVLRLEQIDRRNWIGRQSKVQCFRIADPVAAARAPGYAQPLIGLIGASVAAKPDTGGNIEDFAKRAKQAFGQDFGKFRASVLDALAARGLVEMRAEKVLWLFPTKTPYLTAAGMSMKEALLTRLDDAEQRLPALIGSRPTEAAALIAGLGAMVLLLPNWRDQLPQLGTALRAAGVNHDTMPTSYDSFDDTAITTLGDSLDTLDSFDSGFDSASDSGSGGDGGDSGGDGGSGGD